MECASRHPFILTFSPFFNSFPFLNFVNIQGENQDCKVPSLQPEVCMLIVPTVYLACSCTVIFISGYPLSSILREIAVYSVIKKENTIKSLLMFCHIVN